MVDGPQGMLNRHYSAFPLVGTLLGVSLAILAVWYYNRIISDSRQPAPTSTRVVAPDDASLSTTTAPIGDASPSAGISNGGLPALHSDNSSTQSVAISNDSRQAISPDNGSSTASSATPSGTVLALTAATLNGTVHPITSAVPALAADFSFQRFSMRSKASQQQSHETSESLLGKLSDSLTAGKPICIVELDNHQHPQEIIMTMREVTSDMVESKYQDCQRCLMDSKSTLRVKASINHQNWSLDSLRQFDQAFSRLRSDDKQHLCKTLDVKLPMIGQLALNKGADELALQEVESLNWQSHRYQVPLIGLGNITHLRNLELRSQLSFEDCVILLRCTSQTLQYCHIEEVTEEVGTVLVLPEDLDKRFKPFLYLPVLKSLSIISVPSPVAMLNRFAFRDIEVLKLSVWGKPVDPRKIETIPWLTLNKVHMTCDFVGDGADYVARETPNAATKCLVQI